MTPTRALIHSLFLIAMPMIVAWFGLSFGAALLLVIVMLLWRWLIALSGILFPEKLPELELETIAASHYVEKVRWCMDRLGVNYHERQVVGVLGVFFTGRSVPLLKVRTGIVRSKIGNSSDILRYLWGRYAAPLGDKAKFLEPTRERLALEEKLDRYGRNLQVWVYYHILDDRELTQHVWGCSSRSIPAWQRYTAMVIYPLLKVFMRKAFRINQVNYQKVVGHIERLLGELEASLAEDNRSLTGEDTISFADITFASLSGLWAQPDQYGGGKADEVRAEREAVPVGMQEDMDRWVENYPHANEFIIRLYETER